MAPTERLVRDRLADRILPDRLRTERDPARRLDLLAVNYAEAGAALAAGGYADPEMYAEAIEVLYAMAGLKGISEERIAEVRMRKLAAEGRFSRGLAWSGGGLKESQAAAAGLAVPPKGEVHVYVDGACSGNPGPGGYGAVIVTCDGRVHEIGGGTARTTNNIMELAAATEGLAGAMAFRPSSIVIHLDSTYVRDGITRWIHGWKRRGWTTSSGEPVKNRDLWVRLDDWTGEARDRKIRVSWEWLRGHAGHPGNERADAIARRQAGLARAGGQGA